MTIISKKIKAAGLEALGIPCIITGKGKRHFQFLDGDLNQKKYAANYRINIVLIGAGSMGSTDADVAIQNNGVKLVAACDLYENRLVKAKEKWNRTFLPQWIIVKF